MRTACRWMGCLATVLMAILISSQPVRAQEADLTTAKQLWTQMSQLYRAGKPAEAIPLAKQVLAIRERILGQEDPDTAASLDDLAQIYRETGEYTKGVAFANKALAIRKKRLGLKNFDTATSLNTLASLYRVSGAYEQAEPLYQQSLEILKEVKGHEAKETAAGLSNLATLYSDTGEYAKAQSLYVQALAIYEKVSGAWALDTAIGLNNLGMLYEKTGAYTEAEPLLQRSLLINEKILGLEHPVTASSLGNLGALYHATGAYEQAERILQKALAIKEKVVGTEDPDMALGLNNLAMLYEVTGAYSQAERLYKQALKINKKAFGTKHPTTAASLENLAVLYQATGANSKAAPFLQQALAINKKVLGLRHPDTARSLHNLAWHYKATGAYAQAEPLYRQSLAILEKVFGPDHPTTATSLFSLAAFYTVTSKHAKAEPLYQKSLAIREKVLGTEHPDIVDVLVNLAWQAWRQDRWGQGLELFQRALNVEEINIRRLLGQGDEARKRAYMATLTESTDFAVSFAKAAASNVPMATNLGLEVLLQRKGRVLDVLADSLTRIRASADPEDQALWRRYVAAQSDWSTLSLRGPGSLPVDQYRTRLAELEQQVDAITTELSNRSSQFRAVLKPITLAQVQQALPPHAALLEWIRYRAFNPKAIKMEPRWGLPRYAVYVLKPQGVPVLLDLGDAEALETQVTKLLAAVRQPGGMQGIQELARDLYRRVLQPVQAHLGSATQLLLSPDGQLNLLPFGVLQDTSGHYLVDQYELTYLTSGRDLLRPEPPAEASRPSLLVADPAFDAAILPTRTTTTPASTRRSVDMDRSGLRFDRLKGTAKEAEDLGPLLKLAPSQVLTEARATEVAVKQVQSPRILHLATHGFFLPNLPEAHPATSRAAVALDPDQRVPAPSGENPLLRAGLALAGANQRQSGTDDGLLTALEVSSLDLTGTQLAVLSACETGVGQVQNGEGVYGLRRALVLAGVRTQVVSLWQVNDAATQAFMGHYYRHILNGMGRSAALRATQQRMRENPAWVHPYYWAAFVVIGDPASLPGETPAETMKKAK